MHVINVQSEVYTWRWVRYGNVRRVLRPSAAPNTCTRCGTRAWVADAGAADTVSVSFCPRTTALAATYRLDIIQVFEDPQLALLLQTYTRKPTQLSACGCWL